jgi:hypothetical protein
LPFVVTSSGKHGVDRCRQGRVCRGVELDPRYVDAIIRRYEAVTGQAATLAETGERFTDLAARRAGEAQQPSV